jgi:hypothetical protein
MKPCHRSETTLLACACWLMPAHPTATAINPHSIPFFMEISFGAVVRLAHPDPTWRALFRRE